MLPAMRSVRLKFLFFSLVILGIAAIYSSCKKSAAGSEDGTDYQEVKAWIKQNAGIFKTETVSFKTGNSVTTDHLDWSQVTVYHENNKTVYNIPFSSVNTDAAAIRSVNTQGMTLLPSRTALIVDPSSPLRSYLLIRMYDTSERYHAKVYDFYYDMNGAWKYTWLNRPGFDPQRLYKKEQDLSGQKTSNAAGVKKANACVSINFTSYDISCSGTSMSDVTCVYSPVYNSLSICDGMNESLLPGDDGGGGPPAGGGSGGPSSTPPPVTVSVVDNLTNPCLESLKNQLTDTKLKSVVTKLYNDLYISGDVKLTFNENSTLVDGNGDPLVAKSQYVASTGEWIMQINTNFTTTSTREYIAAGITHELVHSFLTYYKNLTPPGFDFASNLDAHTVMLKGWISQMSGLLVEALGMNATDAVAVVLAQIADVLQNDAGVTYPDVDTWVTDKYNISVGSAKTISDQYKTKGNGKGTTCP